MRELSPFANHRSLAISCLGLFCVGLGLAACKASVKADASAQASSSGEKEVDFDSTGDASWESATGEPDGTTPGGSSAPAGTSTASGAGKTNPSSVALLGARHDLQVADGGAPTCRCLTVVAGDPSTPGLSWEGPIPLINRTTQLVVGLTSQGVKCEETSPEASYMGYQPRGADVIVQVEGAAVGRPVTHGAIVPRPKSGGRILIEGSGNVPYGHAISGQGACVIPL